MVMWIAWEKHRRTLELCNYLSIEPTILSYSLPRIIKHPFLIVKSWYLIHSKCPKVLIVQNPSIFLTLLACLIHKIYKYKLIVDSHNAGLIPQKKILKPLGFIYSYFQREADLTIVTNSGMAEIVQQNGGKCFVLPDKIPESIKANKIRLKGKYNIVYICTFEDDEPYINLIKAAKKFNESVIFYITGNFKKCSPKVIREAIENTIFTGYLSDQDYWDILFSANFIIDLTTRDDCLLCGAYEAVAVETPMILSATKILKNYFSKGAVYTNNHVDNIAKSINLAIKREQELIIEVQELKKELIRSWNEKGVHLSKIIKNSL